MEKYGIPMVPGPVLVRDEILEAGCKNFGSSDLEPEFFDLYNKTEDHLKQILNTENKVVIQSGEGMLALWSAMKSCLKPNDKVLCIATGVFGYGFEQMASSIGCETRIISYDFNESVHDFERIEKAIKKFSPKMITVVHCETPSGTMNSIEEIGFLKKQYNVPLLLVDAVSSIGGSRVMTDYWDIDLCLGASQKCLSAPANMAFLSVSKKAWEIAEEVNYIGYDALLPFKDAQQNYYFPYTPDWHGMAQLNMACEIILEEGVDNCAERHEANATLCRELVIESGLELFADKNSLYSPTVTAVKIPENISWEDLDTKFREKGLVVAGSYGPLAGEIFRIGHMGSQSNAGMIRDAIAVIREVISKC